MEFIEYSTESNKQNDFMDPKGLFILVTEWLLGAVTPAAPHITRKYVLHIASLEKDRNIQVQFLQDAYGFPTVLKSENLESNHCKLGAICIYL